MTFPISDQNQKVQSLKLTNVVNSGIFNANPINMGELFFAYFNQMPSLIIKQDIDCEKADKWFSKKYENNMIDAFYYVCYKGNTVMRKSTYYVAFDDLLLNFDTEERLARLYFRKTNQAIVNEIIAGINKFTKKTGSKPEISLVVSKDLGICTECITIAHPKISISENYNEDLMTVHQTITKRLSQKNDKGLVLLYGKTGTGKTSYIRHLISKVKKNFIFLPPHLTKEISSPQLISVLTEHPNSIFVIEDAENIIIDRDKSENSPVTTLLNITDGLLSDCLNMQIICTFNTNISNVDNALLRKGRLIAKYEFAELETGKAQTLSNKLGFTSKINKPMTLAAIYHQNDGDYQQLKKRNAIGFISSMVTE
jgi:hypothetical protein